MLAIVEQWEGSVRKDNFTQYVTMVLIKMVLNAVSLCFYFGKASSFLSVCSLSIMLADMVMACFIATEWALGSERSPVSVCFLLAFASATYGALQLPMMCLSLLDYCLEDTCVGNRRPLCKVLRNILMAGLMWTLAGIHAYGSSDDKLMEMTNMSGVKVLVCEVQDAVLVNYLILGLFGVVICSMLPYCSMILKWIREADRLSEVFEEQEKKGGDPLLIMAPHTETGSGEDNCPEGNVQPRPPLWFSLILGFSIFWMPYLIVTVGSIVLGYGVPAYVHVNVLWIECVNSLLVGTMFWIKSETLEPDIRLPENVCSWLIYWHLSKGTHQELLTRGASNPSNTNT